MTICVRLNDADTELVRKYAELNAVSISDLVRKALMEKIEDEIDLKLWEEAMTEYRQNPVTYSHEEVKRMLLETDE